MNKSSTLFYYFSELDARKLNNKTQHYLPSLAPMTTYVNQDVYLLTITENSSQLHRSNYR